METMIKRPQVTISAIVTRKDGTIEDLGIICENAEITISKEDENNG